MVVGEGFDGFSVERCYGRRRRNDFQFSVYYHDVSIFTIGWSQVMLNIPCGPGTVSAVSSENGFGLRNWVSDLVVGLYCICRLNIDFQQANGRRVGVKVDIMFEGIEVR